MTYLETALCPVFSGRWMSGGMKPDANIFDTISLRCWAGAFSLWGRNIGVRALQVFSGMDGNDMLRRLAPDLSKRRLQLTRAAPRSTAAAG